MLLSLMVKNFALIEEAKIDFSSGFNILTGETGAGKSILIDAFGAILGGRMSNSYIRDGENSFLVQAVFDISDNKDLISWLIDRAIVDSEDDCQELIIVRRVLSNGKNIVTVNGISTTTTVLKELRNFLVDIHGQYENQRLLVPSTHLKLLDLYGDKKIIPTLTEYKQTYFLWRDLAKKISTFNENVLQSERRRDLLIWEIQEIEQANLKLNEEDKLNSESSLLANSEKIAFSLNNAYQLLDGTEDTSSVLDMLSTIKKELESASRYVDAAGELLNVVSESIYSLQDVKHEILLQAESIEANPERLQVVQKRLDIIYRLKKKYGATIKEVLEYLEQSRTEYEELSNLSNNLEELMAEESRLLIKLQVLADKLTQERTIVAQELCSNLTQHINDLGMEKAIFSVEIKLKEEYTENGIDDVQFYFSANLGQVPRPLQQVASGGEISRIALAIKTVLIDESNIPTMIFDEVDTGVGGVTAQRMAEKLSFIATNRQVLCITHLPQIAAMADRHIFIEKNETIDSTITTIKNLSEDQRISELMRMLTGDDNSDLARQNAEQMITNANKRKQNRG